MNVGPERRGYEFVTTCFATPEIVDLSRDGKYRGYYRLRHGLFRVCDAEGNEMFHRAFPLKNSDDLTEIESDLLDTEGSVNPDGIFESTLQRDVYEVISVSALEGDL